MGICGSPLLCQREHFADVTLKLPPAPPRPGEMEAAGQVAEQESEELLPVSTGSMPLGINEALAIYAELTGAGLRVDEDVRQFSGLIHLPKEIPPMTRASACSLFEKTLEDQAELK